MYFRCCLHTACLISLLCSSFVLYVPVPTCVCFVQFLISVCFSITFVSFPPHLLALPLHSTPPPICCLHSFPFCLHSCSPPCHSVSFSTYFFLSCLFPLHHLHSSLSPFSACGDGNHTMPVSAIYIQTYYSQPKSIAMLKRRKYVVIFDTDTQLKVSQCHRFTLM